MILTLLKSRPLVRKFTRRRVRRAVRIGRVNLRDDKETAAWERAKTRSFTKPARERPASLTHSQRHRMLEGVEERRAELRQDWKKQEQIASHLAPIISVPGYLSMARTPGQARIMEELNKIDELREQIEKGKPVSRAVVRRYRKKIV